MASVRSISKLFGCVVSAGALSGFYLTKTQNEFIWSNLNMPLVRLLDAENAHKLAVKLASYGLVPSFQTLPGDKDLLVSRSETRLLCDSSFLLL